MRTPNSKRSLFFIDLVSKKQAAANKSVAEVKTENNQPDTSEDAKV